MKDSRPFHFKHFSLYHHRATMKVGTDAVLLGSWVEVKPTDRVLDIGTGSGILPLMLSQKGIFSADAVDIDFESVEEARTNFEASRWKDRLKVFKCDIRAFCGTDGKKYDLIVSNPPFFCNSFKSDTERKNKARHTDAGLLFEDLLQSVVRLLKDDGRFALVLPFAESQNFIDVAMRQGLYLNKLMLIIPVEGKEANRINMEFSFTKTEEIKKDRLTIRDTDNGFTGQYDSFLKDFYLGL